MEVKIKGSSKDLKKKPNMTLKIDVSKVVEEYPFIQLSS
jgi:hypothetical protein